jgi:hypothetical protein
LRSADEAAIRRVFAALTSKLQPWLFDISQAGFNGRRPEQRC